MLIFRDANTKSATTVGLRDCGSSALQSMTSVPCDQLLNLIMATSVLQ